MKKLLYAFLGIAVVAFMSCNYYTTKSGLRYKILGKAAGAAHVGTPLKVGNFVKWYFRYTIPENKDTVLRDGYGQMPVYSKVDTGANVAMNPLEIFPKLRSGDSVELLVSIDSLLSKTPPGQAPPFFKKGQHIKAIISVMDVFTSEADAKADMMKEQEKEMARQKVKLDSAAAELDKYISSNGIKAVKTPKGAYVVVTNPGDATAKADSGMQVSLNYTGSLVGGKPFDSNTDTTFHHTQPFTMVVNAHQAIQGMDEALPYFGKGGQGKIYIPAGLGYGAQQGNPKSPPYSNLVFDIQVLDVKKAEIPKRPAFNTAMMQRKPPMQMQPMTKGTPAPAHR
jgi:FKBP-type peptidyl-prolyl cis-trans isomerase